LAYAEGNGYTTASRAGSTIIRAHSVYIDVLSRFRAKGPPHTSMGQRPMFPGHKIQLSANGAIHRHPLTVRKLRQGKQKVL
jgi:hypothetical protein